MNNNKMKESTINQSPTLYPQAQMLHVTPYGMSQQQQNLQTIGQQPLRQQSQLPPMDQQQPQIIQQQQLQQQQSVSTDQPAKLADQSQTSVIIYQPKPILCVGREPQRMVCPHCNVKMVTQLDYRATTRTHVIALVLCLLGFWCFVPVVYCMQSCKALDHYCSNCNQFIGNMREI